MKINFFLPFQLFFGGLFWCGCAIVSVCTGRHYGAVLENIRRESHPEEN